MNFLFQLIFACPLFLGMVMCSNEFKTKEKQVLTKIKKLTATDTRTFCALPPVVLASPYLLRHLFLFVCLFIYLFIYLFIISSGAL